MPRKRSIKVAKGSIENRIKYDKDFLVKATPFNINIGMKDSIAHMYEIDPFEGSEVIATPIPTKTYNRDNFISNTMEFIRIINKLSPKAFKLLEYIIKTIPFNSNYIKLDGKSICDIIDDKYQSNASKYLNELINNKLLAKSNDEDNKNIYVINHNMFFKGNYNLFIYRYNKVYAI